MYFPVISTIIRASITANNIGRVTMRTVNIVAITVVLGCAATAFLPVAVQPAIAEDASNAFDGEWRYQTSCGSCHGKNGEGIYAFAPALKGNAFVIQSPASVIINVIQNGRYNRNKTYPKYPGMPAFYDIRAGEAEALVNYLKGDLQQ